MGSGNSVPYCSQIFWRISFRITSSDTSSLCFIENTMFAASLTFISARYLLFSSKLPPFTDTFSSAFISGFIMEDIASNFSEIKRMVIHVGFQRLYCFFCLYTHFHFKCRPQMLICINFNRPVMNPHNFSHHRKSKPHTSKFPAS